MYSTREKDTVPIKTITSVKGSIPLLLMVAHPTISPSTSRSTPSTVGDKNRYKIKAPTTTNDSGEPSDLCFFDAKRVLRLIEDERYLSAQELYNSILDRLQESENNSGRNDNDNVDNNNNKSKNRKRPSSSLLKRQNSTTKAKVNEKNYVLARELLDDNEDILNKMEVRTHACG